MGRGAWGKSLFLSVYIDIFRRFFEGDFLKIGGLSFKFFLIDGILEQEKTWKKQRTVFNMYLVFIKIWTFGPTRMEETKVLVVEFDCFSPKFCYFFPTNKSSKSVSHM